MKDLNMNGLMETVKETKVAKKTLSETEKLEMLIRDKKVTGMLETILPKEMDKNNFLAHIFLVIKKNPALAKCSADSFISAMLTVAEVGIKPNMIDGEAYLIPYGNNIQLQLGYKGLLKIIRRSFPDIVINQAIVKENDNFEIEQGFENKIIHKYNWNERGETVGYYATFNIPSTGQNGFAFMTKEEIQKHRQTFSKGGEIWNKNFDEMAIKTVIKKALKYLTWDLDKKEEGTALKVLKNDENIVKNVQATEEDLILETNEEIIEIDDLQEKIEDEVK